MSTNIWGSDDPVEVAKGGTGAATLTDHGVLLGSGTSPVTVTPAPTNGQLLIGNTGSDPSVAAPTGDTNEISITTGAGSLAVGIADNPVLPGTSAYTWVDGTTAQEPSGSNGQARYDTTTNKFRGYENGAWVNFITSSTGTGSWVLLNTQTASAAASVEWDNTYVNATYDSYAIVLHRMYHSGSALVLRLSNDNGSTFHASGYLTRQIAIYSSITANNFTTDWRLGSTASSGVPSSGVIYLQDLYSSSYKSQAFTDVWMWTGSILNRFWSHGAYNTAEQNDAIQIASDGNTTGEFSLYGITN